MSDIHKIGADAVAALKALNAAKAAKKSKTAKANELIEERNEIARPLLQQVHDSIVSGHPVNGCSTWDGWAKYARWSKRQLNNILNGRKPQTGNSSSRPSFLKRIADAKKKLTDIQRQIDAPMDGVTPRDFDGLDKQIDPVANEVFQEFLAALAPDGYTIGFNGRHWFIQEKDEEPAAPKVKKSKKKERQPVAPTIKIKLTKAQMREVKWTPAFLQRAVAAAGNTLTFQPESYQEHAKEMVEALERRIEKLRTEADEQRTTLGDWNDKSPKNKAAFDEQKRLQGSITACESALRHIAFSSEALSEWYQQREDEKFEAEMEPPQVTVVIKDNCQPEKDYSEDEVKALFEEAI